MSRLAFRQRGRREETKAFLYLLMRDTVVPGEVERLVREAERCYDGSVYWPQHWLCSLSWRLDQRWKTGVWKETTEQDDK